MAITYPFCSRVLIPTIDRMNNNKIERILRPTYLTIDEHNKTSTNKCPTYLPAGWDIISPIIFMINE